MSNKVTLKWNEFKQNVFGEIKRIVTRNNLLSFPDLNKHYYMHANYSDFQLESVISQEVKPIVFYSKKLIGPFKKTVAGKELLIIVETLK